MDRLASRSSGVASDSGSAPTILGLSRTCFLRRAGQENPAKKSLKKFDAWTKQKNLRSIQLLQARKFRGNPYAAAPELDPRKKLRTGKVISGHQLPSSGDAERSRVKRPPGGNIIVVDTCKEPAPEREGYRCSRPATTARSLLQQVQAYQMIIMDSSWQCDNLTQHSDQALAIYLAIVALGKPTISRAQYLQSSSRGPLDRALVLYRPVFRETKLSLHLGEEFKRESPLLRDVFQWNCETENSVWKFAEAPGAGGTCTRLRKHVRSFLLNTRRAGHAGGGILGGKSSLRRPVV